jgi:hypothetical protein
MWKRILSFLEKEEVDSIITEEDFGLYILVPCQPELYLWLAAGCVHPGFGLIGFTLYKVSGDDADFDAFENRLTEWLGF